MEGGGGGERGGVGGVGGEGGGGGGYYVLMIINIVIDSESHTASKYKGPFSTDCRERGFHARGVYPTQDTSRMRTARAKQEEEVDTRIIAIE